MFAKTVARSHVFYAPPFAAAVQSSTLRFWRLAVYRNRYRDRVWPFIAIDTATVCAVYRNVTLSPSDDIEFAVVSVYICPHDD